MLRNTEGWAEVVASMVRCRWGIGVAFTVALGLLVVIGTPSFGFSSVDDVSAANDAAEPSAPAKTQPGETDKSADETSASDTGAGKLIASLTIFVLAIFVGFEVITKVPPTLHTPLMSGSNAISGITLVGALVAAGTNEGLAAVLGMIAVALATVNAVGGFLVTHRMLDMFRKK